MLPLVQEWAVLLGVECQLPWLQQLLHLLVCNLKLVLIFLLSNLQGIVRDILDNILM